MTAVSVPAQHPPANLAQRQSVAHYPTAPSSARNPAMANGNLQHDAPSSSRGASTPTRGARPARPAGNGNVEQGESVYHTSIPTRPAINGTAEHNAGVYSASPQNPGASAARSRPNMSARSRSELAPSSFRRPSSAPGNNQAGHLSQYTNGRRNSEDDDDDDDDDAPLDMPTKPPLLRSKSERGLRFNEANDPEFYEWGARHGFEDHYQSEDIISQLATVSRASVPSVGVFRASGAWLTIWL